ncbi:MAG: DUF1015 domain-containing protein [Promethearchaeota archaeon]
MVDISPIRPYIPINPEEFCTNPYDVIDKEEEKKLKKNPNSLVHLILPDGEGDELYQNAANAYRRFKENRIIKREKIPSIYVYRQESARFSHQGFIMGASLQDYDDGKIIIHEHTREKALKDRTKHIVATNVAAGLVWTVFQANNKINHMIEQIKKKDPKLHFEKYGYKHILWQENDNRIIQKLQELFHNKNLYIADGHHRAASAAEYRKIQLQKYNAIKEAPWQYLLSYIASDDQIRILPYNRVIRRLPLNEKDFLTKLEPEFKVKAMERAFQPQKKNELAICIKGNWYKLIVKDRKFKTKRDSLDVSILQDKILKPILGIADPRTDENIFFVGGIQDLHEMERYTTKGGNDMFISLYPVNIKDLESIANKGGIMPPKSTWFDPKLLSGLVMHELKEY